MNPQNETNVESAVTEPATAEQKSPLAKAKALCEQADVARRIPDAARFYRVELNWAVHPLVGPRNSSVDEKTRGKQPLHTGWRTWTADQASDQYLEEHFEAGLDSNLGVVVRPPFIVVDLDSKADKGESVRNWLATQPELADVPRERTGGGAHLHFRCEDLPPITKKDGKPYGKALVSKITETVTAEMFFDGLNIVVAPSTHANGTIYAWEQTGPIPEIEWVDLQRLFGFRLPDEPKADAPETKSRRKEAGKAQWWVKYKGDLKSLDLTKLFGSFKMLGKGLSADKTVVQCPWQDEHSDAGKPGGRKDSSTVILTSDSHAFPGFCCQHAHCQGRGLEQVLEWFEQKSPGVVDQHCARQRVWKEGQKSKDGLPRLVLPAGTRTDSIFAAEAGKLIGAKQVWFLKNNEVIWVHRHQFSKTVEYLAFCPIEPVEVCSAIEAHVETGVLRTNQETREREFSPQSLVEQDAKKLLNAPQFKVALPRIDRILDVPLPIRHHGEIVFPTLGYDSQFSTYCDPNAPAIAPVSMDEARKVLAQIYEGFCWKTKRDLVHGLARLITPFTRGLMGWDARFPLWFFEARSAMVRETLRMRS